MSTRNLTQQELQDVADGGTTPDALTARCIIGLAQIVERALDDPRYQQADDRMGAQVIDHLRRAGRRVKDAKLKREAEEAIARAHGAVLSNFYSEITPLRTVEPVWGHFRMPVLSQVEWDLFCECADGRSLEKMVRDYARYRLQPPEVLREKEFKAGLDFGVYAVASALEVLMGHDNPPIYGELLRDLNALEQKALAVTGSRP